MAKVNRKTIDATFTILGTALILVLLAAAGLGLYAYNFATGSVRHELSAQNVYFPAAGSPGFSAEEFPTLQKYAGQQVDDGAKAKAYANDYIAKHLEQIANGKTYAEVSADGMKDPTNQALQQQKQTLFQGETLRGLLLGDGYAYWTFGMIALYASIAAFVGAVIMSVLVLLGLRRIKKS